MLLLIFTLQGKLLQGRKKYSSIEEITNQKENTKMLLTLRESLWYENLKFQMSQIIPYPMWNSNNEQWVKVYSFGYLQYTPLVVKLYGSSI